jgi:hypothetical protein
MRTTTFALSTLLAMAGTASALAASSEADFRTAFAAAEAANNGAGALRDQWTTTVSTLAAAKKAAAEGDFDKAVIASREAEALARASIFQANEQKDAWKALEIR